MGPLLFLRIYIPLTRELRYTKKAYAVPRLGALTIWEIAIKLPNAPPRMENQDKNFRIRFILPSQ
jgi:hypothetical protein